jgi:hypothetical protein
MLTGRHETLPDFRPMILGQSLFDAVLDRLAEEAGEDLAPGSVDVEAPFGGVKGLNTGFIGASIETPLAGGLGRLEDAYFDFTDDERAPPQPSREEHRFARLTPQDVAEDLRLSDASSAETLQRLRREFARQNHPDMVGEEWRDQATLRMKIANLLIDEALKRLPANAR